MLEKISGFIDLLSEFLAARKGLIPLIGIIFVIMNFGFQFIPGLGVIADNNLFLHLGIIVSVFGLLLAQAL